MPGESALEKAYTSVKATEATGKNNILDYEAAKTALEQKRSNGNGNGNPNGESANGKAQATEQPTPPPETFKKPAQSEFVEGGNQEKAVEIDIEIQKQLSDRINSRYQDAVHLKGTGLSTLEEQLLKLGPGIITRLKAGEATTDDLLLTQALITDETMQKSFATQRLIKQDKIAGKHERWLNIRFFKHFAQETRMETSLDKGGPQLTSEYIKFIKFAEKTPQQIEADLKELNQLRLTLEGSYAGGIEEPLFDEVTTSLYPTDLVKPSKNRLRLVVIEQLEGQKGILARRHEGKTFVELLHDDPVAAIQAYNEANEIAYFELKRDVAERLATEDKPTIDINKLKSQAEKAKEAPKEEEKEDQLKPLKETQEKAKEAFDTANTKLKGSEGQEGLRTKLESLRKNKVTKDRESIGAQKTYADTSALLTPKINTLQTEITTLNNIIAQISTSTTLTDEQKANALKPHTPALEKLRTILKSYDDKLTELLAKRASADAEKESIDQQIKELEGVPAGPGGAPPAVIGEIEKTENDLAAKEAALKTADKTLLDKQREFKKGGTPEALKRSEAIDDWEKVYYKYGDIIAKLYSQRAKDEFSSERLSDTNERSNGQMEGTESIRELIFQTAYKEAGYDPERARRMLSDETIARAIVWVYKIDTSKTDVVGISINDKINNIQQIKDNIAALPPGDPAKEALERALTTQGKILAQTVLPNLNSSYFEDSKLVQFLIHEGLKSAENGNPYLEINNQRIETKPDLEMAAETVLKENVGHVEFNKNIVTWTGETTNTAINGLVRQDLPLLFRVSQDYDARNPNGSFHTALRQTEEVAVNLSLLQSLPEDPTAIAALPDALRDTFYDANQQLREQARTWREMGIFSHRTARERGFSINIPEWVTIREDVITDAYDHKAADNALNNLGHDISADAPAEMAIATANAFLDMKPEERKGFRGVINRVEFAGGAVAPARITLEIDNDGELIISNAAENERDELKHFYTRSTEDMRRFFQSQTLNTNEREYVGLTLRIIQEALGKEILRAKQRA